MQDMSLTELRPAVAPPLLNLPPEPPQPTAPQRPDAADLASRAESVLVCRLAGLAFGLGLTEVREIRSFEPPRGLPGAPVALLGVIDLRGVVVPVFDLRVVLGRPAAPGTGAGLFVVVEHEGVAAGLRVDAVSEVVELPAGALRPLPPLSTTAHAAAQPPLHWLGAAPLGDELLLRVDLPSLLRHAGLPDRRPA